jgi:Thoeris protein ThsA, Macro domain
MLLRRIQIGVRRHPWRWILESSVVCAALWGVLEPAFGLLGLHAPGLAWYLVFVAISVAVGLSRALPPVSVSRSIPGSNTALTISFGDLFTTIGLRAVPVNEYFDSELGPPVSPNSIHGQLIQREFGGHADAFDRQVQDGVRLIPGEQRPRVSGKQFRYPLGTAVEIGANNNRYLAFVLCHTDTDTYKAFASVADLWIALHGLWEKARELAGGDALAVPLVGGGLSGIGLPPQHLLSFLVISLLDATKHSRVTGEIVIILQERTFDEIDLSAAISLLG